MFLRRINELSNHLSFRLTVWYAAVFTLCSLLVLLIFYSRISFLIKARIDQELLDDIFEYAKLLQTDGFESVKQDMNTDANSEKEYTIFFRLFTNTGALLASTNMSQWGLINTNFEKIKQTSNNLQPVFETLLVDDKPYEARSVYAKIGKNLVMQIGLYLEESEEYLAVFRKLLFLILAPVMLLATMVGWFMSKQALLGIEEVAKAADEISGGNSNKRVKITKKWYEIDRLASSFNAMVDQLHSLLRQMREMTDNIAHDLRSPLTRIRGYAEMTLIGKPSDMDFKEMAVSTVEECDSLINMINTMLDIAETESGLVEFKFESIDLNQLIRNARELYASIAKEKEILITLQLPGLATINGDRSKLERMIANLLENAIKYTPPQGKVTISVGMKKNLISIQIADTGLGISENEIPKIFQRFYRCDTSRSESGLGLGLSLAKALAESLGGSISVKSVLSRGSIFTISLPQPATL
jgi:signal transduction histidine kinase